jgi:hypothetical protein
MNRFSWALLAVLTALILTMNIVQTRADWSRGPLHPTPTSHAMPEEDFANLWAAGKMVRAGDIAGLYGAASFEAWRQKAFGADVQEEDWVYPPTVLLLGVPLSFLPLLAGFLLWDAVTLLLAVLLLRAAGLRWPVLLFGLLGPAAWRSLTLGQYGVLTGALVVAGLMLAPRYPVRAGILLGISTLKPQQGIIAPFAWAGASNFRAMIAAALTFAAMAVAVALLFGAAWQLFISGAGTNMRHLLDAPPPQNYISDGTSVFWMLRTMGAGIAPAYAGQIFMALAAAGLGYWVWRRPAPALPRVALSVCLSLLIMPYGFTSDMVAFSIALALLIAEADWRLTPLDVAIWLWPAYCPLMTLKTGWLLTPLVIICVAARAWRGILKSPPSNDLGVAHGVPAAAMMSTTFTL